MLLATLCLGLSAYWDEPDAYAAFLVTFLATGAFASVFWMVSRGGEIHLTLRRSILLLALIWFAVPLLGALPAYELVPGTSLIRAWCDAVSQFTTTASIIVPLEHAPRAFWVWQAGMQWLGGFITVVSAVLILGPLNLTAPGVHQSPLLTIEEGNVAGSLRQILLTMLLVYGGFSLAIVLFLFLTGVSATDALIVGFTSIATGGFLPHGDYPGTVLHGWQIWIAAAGMLIGATGFALHWDAIRLRASYFKDPETIGIGILIIVVAGVFVLASGKSPDNAILAAISLVSTSSMPLTNGIFDHIPHVVAMALVLTGGAAISTAGGVKLIRFIMLFNQMGSDLFKLSHPSSVRPVLFRGVPVEPSSLVGLWVYVLGYAALIAFVISALGAGGVTFDKATEIAVGVISNAGLFFTGTNGNHGDLSNLPDGTLTILAAAMAFGRMEILAVLTILSPDFWRE